MKYIKTVEISTGIITEISDKLEGKINVMESKHLKEVQSNYDKCFEPIKVILNK